MEPFVLFGKLVFIQCGCWDELCSPYRSANGAQHWIKIVSPCAQEFYPVLGLRSVGRLLRHFQTPTLHWIHFKFVQFYSIVRIKIGHSPFKTWSFWSAERAILGAKRTNGEFGLQESRPPNSLNACKTNKTAIGPIARIALEFDRIDCKTAEERPKDKWFHFHATPCSPSHFQLSLSLCSTNSCVYYEARNDYTNYSETFLLCNRCVCSWKINCQRILLCKWRLQKVPHGGALITQKNSCQRALCNRCPVQLGN